MLGRRQGWRWLVWTLSLTLLWLLAAGPGWGGTYRSHPPLRPLPQPSQRPMAAGRGFFVAPEGDDSQPGTLAKPWRTINAALGRLEPGDTLYLRQGVYYENVYCAVAGRPGAAITIRSYPGEVAVVDGGLPEFQSNPAGAWQPAAGGVEGEYVSSRVYRNIRDVVGRFGDSLVGLQTYWYAMDLRADNEAWLPDEKIMVKPVYCGPGLWYDRHTGRIHCRLAHTKLKVPASGGYEVPRYEGETDPRRLPLILAPLAAIALKVDQAMHVTFQDLVLRGGGYVTVALNFGIDLTFDNCTIFAGTYGIWAKNTGPLKMTNCGIYGMIPPWAFRQENSLFSYRATEYPPFWPVQGRQSATAPATAGKSRAERNLARLPTHALLVTAGGYEFEVFYYPANHSWEIDHCEFTDGHDGVYLSGVDIRFHHNWVDNVQDDAIYLSSPTPFYPMRLFIHQNLISTCTTAFAAHGRGGPGGDIWVYRNIVDMRRPIQYRRPGPEVPPGAVLIPGSMLFQVHGAKNLIHMENISFYQNTFLYPASHPRGAYTGGLAFGRHAGAKRWVMNNIFLFYGLGGRYPQMEVDRQAGDNLVVRGNLHWNLQGSGQPAVSQRLAKRESPGKGEDRVADPQLRQTSNDWTARNDYQLTGNSPAIGAGVPLPQEWPEVFGGRGRAPDIGALPYEGGRLRVGRYSRLTAGSVWEP